MPRPPLLKLENLEDRTVPSASVWGTPWLDGSHLTLSLAPDGTNISGTPSSLSQVLAAEGPNSELTLLQAFQSWADVANINLGLVSDGGEAFGIGKAIQGDPRFGDIRIGARPLASDTGAITSPFDYFNTYSGDVILNSVPLLGSTYSLASVAIHEAGHAFGLPDNLDSSSVMYQYYTGANDTLSASDIAAIQALYGARVPNTTSDTLATALPYTAPVYAQLNTATDADYYKFTTPLLLTGTTIHLQAEGLSLLDAQVSVYNSKGTFVASSAATDPTNNDVTLDLNNLNGLSTYYVKVSSPNGGVFDIGSYQLSIQNNVLGLVDDLAGGAIGLLTGVGHTLATATNLAPNSTTVGAQVNYNARASLSKGTQTDVYAVQAPASPTGAPVAMVSTVWGLGGANISPRFQVFDNQGDPVAFQVLTNTTGASTIQVANATPGATYEMKISSASGQKGNYSLAVEFIASPITFPMGAAGTLNEAGSSTSGTLDVQESQVMHFVLAAGTVPSDPKTLLTLTITDSSGNTVDSLQTAAGDAESLDVFLEVGTYTVTISESTTSDDPLQDVDFTLGVIGVTEPVSAAPANSATAAAGSSSSSTSSSTSTSSSSSTPSSSSTSSSSSTTPSSSTSTSSTSSSATLSSTTTASTAWWN